MYLAVMLWAIYVIKYLNDNGVFGKLLSTTVSILLILEIGVLFFNHFHHFFFWVDEAAVYHTYTFRYVAFAIQVILFNIISIYAFIHEKKISDVLIKNRYRAIGYFSITMAVAVIFQILYPLLPVYSIGCMIGACFIHVYIIEDENSELRRKADEANMAKTSFLFSMSHDIRTPMNAILGYADMAINHSSDTELLNNSLNKIKASGLHLMDLINDILEMSRIESGNLELSLNPLDIRESIAVVEDMSKVLASSKDINLTVKIGEIKNPYIYADELRMNEIFINLLSNAIKYTDRGGKVQFNICQLADSENNQALYHFEVIDNGIGMSEEFQKHLFETFAREKSSTVSKIEGSGIGLSIVKKIVDLANGKIEVESELGRGSTFRLEMAFSIMEKSDIDMFVLNKDKKKYKDLSNLHGKRVLLAEDNEMNREIAVYILEEGGFTVDAVEDGQKVLDVINEKGPSYYDFVLMDIQMPVMNGYEATRAIRQIAGCEKLPIIAVSANAFAEDKTASLEAGMNGHIAKPINVEELFDTLSKFA